MDNIQPQIIDVLDKNGNHLEVSSVVKSGDFFEVDLLTSTCPKEKESITIFTDSMEYFCEIEIVLSTVEEGISKLKATINSAIICS